MNTKFKYVVLMEGVFQGKFFPKWARCKTLQDALDVIDLYKREYPQVDWQEINLVEVNKIYMREDEFRKDIEEHSVA